MILLDVDPNIVKRDARQRRAAEAHALHSHALHGHALHGLALHGLALHGLAGLAGGGSLDGDVARAKRHGKRRPAMNMES